jgi:hypothetical protein
MPVAGTPQYFTDGVPGAGQQATVLPGYQMNAIQEEILAVIAATGIAFDRTNNAQLLAALQGLGSFSMGAAASRCRIPGTPLLVQHITGTVVAASGGGAGLPSGLFAQSLGALSWPISFSNACIWAKGMGDVASNNYVFDMEGTRGQTAWFNTYAFYNQTVNNIPYSVFAVGY